MKTLLDANYVLLAKNLVLLQAYTLLEPLYAVKFVPHALLLVLLALVA